MLRTRDSSRPAHTRPPLWAGRGDFLNLTEKEASALGHKLESIQDISALPDGLPFDFGCWTKLRHSSLLLGAHGFTVVAARQAFRDGLVGSPCSPRDSQESSPTL